MQSFEILLTSKNQISYKILTGLVLTSQKIKKKIRCQRKRK